MDVTPDRIYRWLSMGLLGVANMLFRYWRDCPSAPPEAAIKEIRKARDQLTQILESVDGTSGAEDG